MDTADAAATATAAAGARHNAAGKVPAILISCGFQMQSAGVEVS